MTVDMQWWSTTLWQSQPWLGWCLAVVIGLMGGSFIGCLVYRLPKMLFDNWQRYAQAVCGDASQSSNNPVPSLSLWYPPSHCPHCGGRVGVLGLIPIVGFLLLKGRCHHCKSAIHLRYPCIEASYLAIVLWCYANYSMTWFGIMVAVFGFFALALAWIDAEHNVLPDQLQVPFLWLGLIVNYFELLVPFEASFWGCVGAYLLFGCIAWAAQLLLRKEALGWGDVKLFAALAAWLGWEILPLIIFMACVGGLLFLVVRRMLFHIAIRDPMPFGPFVLGAGWVVIMLHLHEVYWI